MSVVRRANAPHTKLRRTVTAAVLAVASGASFLAAAGPAHAASTWFVAPAPLGVNNAACGTAIGSPCATVTFTIAKVAFLDGDTINVAAGTYVDRPAFAGKTATIVGAGTASTIFSGSATAAAMTVNVGNPKTFRLSNATLTAGKLAIGAALPITTGQVVLNSVNVTNSVASNVGGAVSVPAGGSLTATGGTFSGNTATNGGGAIYNPASATVTLNGVTLSGNGSNLGGAIYAAAGSTTNLNNGTVSTNSGSGAGGGAYAIGTLNVNGTTFNANTSPLGAGLAVAAAPTITAATISNNVSTNQGGGIYFNTVNLVINGGTSITGNKSPTGAGIYQEGGTTTITGSSITNNISAANGGGFYSKAGAFNATNSTITGNTAATLGGAGVVLTGTSAIAGGSISNNASPNGGALYNGGTTTIDGTALNGNTANGGALANSGNGGAIYNAAALVVKNATLAGNKAVLNTNATPGIGGYGGAVFSANLAANAPSLDFTNTTIDGGAGSGDNAYIGGAIGVYQTTVGGTTTKITGNGLTLSNNRAQAAGGLFSYGSVTLNGSTVQGNKATNAAGGGLGGGLYTAAIAGTTPQLVLDDTDVLGNDAVAGGGGAIIGAGVTTTIRNGSKVDNNTAATGAGLYNGSALTITDSQVNGNNASANAGGVYSLGATTLTNTKVDNNTSAFLAGGLLAGAPLTVTGGEFSGNNAFAAGGALVSDGIAGSITGTTFAGNTSTGANFGGGAILSGGQLTVKDATFTGNTADGTSGSGGAIFSGSSNDNVATSLKVDSSLFSGNEAAVAAAIVAGSSGTGSTNKTSINNSTITGNASTTAVGALEFLQQTSITGSTITDNTAVGATNYGALFATAGTVSISGSILSGNSGKQCATAPTDGGYNLISPTDATCAFSAGKHDVFAAPQLGALASNGGTTKTLLPGSTSPALDKIPAGTATGVTDGISGSAVTLCGAGAVDQRGTSRPQGAKCDIGAVEANQTVPTISGPSSATYSVGIAGAPQAFTSTGSPQPTLSATGLPAGVTFVDNGDGTGTLAGTPGAGTGGVHAITVKATNEAGSDSKVFTLTITQAPALAGPAAATYTVGTPGGQSLFTSTGHPTSMLVSLGVLPGGVGFTDNNDGTGAYAGTPNAGTGGLYNLTVKASNGTLPDATAPFALTVNEAPGLTGPGSATFKVGTSSASTPDFAATGFPVPTLSATGLPAGLSVVSTGSGTGKISGSAANGTGGAYPGVVVKATNGVGAPATKPVNVTVNEAPELVGPTEARFVTGSANEIGFSSDGFPQATITRSGALPAGLSFVDNGNGSAKILGTATASSVGTYAITITASNGQSPDAVIHLVLEVVPPLSIATSSLPNAAYHSAYSAQLLSNGGQPGYTYAVTMGQLPAGLTMNAFGLITGSPTVSAGTYIFTVKATDSANPAQTAVKILKITVTKGATRITPTAILLGFLPNGDITINLGLVEADLKGGFPEQPVVGATVTFKSGNATVCSGKTDVKGHAQCSQSILNALLTPIRGNLTATFAGDLNWTGSTGSASLIQKTNTP